jgi:energy-coupling factor transporter ATP-binding protein EcfA2
LELTTILNKSNYKKWLTYWKNSVADADRKSIQVSTFPIIVESYILLEVPKKQAQYLWNISNGNDSIQTIPVDISPCSYLPEYDHAKLKDTEPEALYPFWIPANMDKEGRLTANGKPFFVRDYLTPNPTAYYKISSIQEVDDCLKQFEFKASNWQEHWADCEKFFKTVTQKSFDEYNVGNDKKIYVEKGELRNVSGQILNLYQSLIESPSKSPLLNKLIGFEKEVEKDIPSNFDCLLNFAHLGQMNEALPLSVSQRQSMRVYTAINENEILAVNGPPGTGKTTLLQSIVANSIVSTVVENKAPELIVASSANNQAITNILKSFELESKSSFSQRWLPKLDCWGLYFTGNETKYPKCSSAFGDGFMKEYENSDFEEKVQYFLKLYEVHYSSETSIEKCKSKLQGEVKKRVQYINEHLQIAQKYESNQEVLKSFDCGSIYELEVKISNLKDSINQVESTIKVILEAEKLLLTAKSQQSFIENLFHFLPKTKQRRTSSYKRALMGITLNNTTDYSSFKSLTDIINNQIIDSNEQKLELEKNKSLLENKLVEIKNNSEKYNSTIQEWNNKYSDKLTNLYKITGEEYQNLSPLEDMSVRVDITFRSEAFWFAVHYREAEYLLLLKKLDPKDKERGDETYKKRLQRYARITPIFISTFHALPKYATYYTQTQGELPYYGLFDMLIVDESGQVTPDNSIPSFALAKKAIVVGDILQIEPVWSVGENIDWINLESNNLIKDGISDVETKRYIESGMLSSSGNLMKLAQNACGYCIDGTKGTLLREHRRCLDSIISYSNKYIYKNQLIPKKGETHSANHNLPSKGFLQINSTSEKSGESRRNPKEAEIIAKWIDSKRTELESAYGKKIHEILAIVTPYKSQAFLIKKLLLEIDKKIYSRMISGTVHALQGAEIEIVIFSTVVSKSDSTYFINNKNLLNVAISRAKHSFLVFGNMNALEATKGSPLGNLKEWLIENENCELSNNIVFESTIIHSNKVARINKLQEHVGTLRRAFEVAVSELIIVSPFISINAILSDAITELAAKSIEKGVKVIVFTDANLDMKNGKLKDASAKGREMLMKSGIVLKIINGIHNKTLIVDDDILVEGSFNWLSAVRDEKSPYFRVETSIVLKGEEAKKIIVTAKKDLKLN